MKELSIEQKAKAYDEAIERAKGVIEQNPLMEYLKKGIEYILPALKESEDEKIRKGIIRNLEYLMDRAEGFVKDELKERIAWLEKQGENSVCKVKIGETYKCIASPRYTCFRKGDTYHVKDNFVAELINLCSGCFVLLEKQSEQKDILDKAVLDNNEDGLVADTIKYNIKQKPVKWSEEDEYHKRQILRILKDNGCSQTLQEKTEKWIEERLKSLSPQNHWKPSEEQIVALIWVLNNIPYCTHKEEISGLLEQLKKLNE